ncbi:MAG: nucleotidyltransferase family protein [Bacteroidales bacterium]|nr:nucleotidyltransferase family protein [Bacteroidales bacterium]
MKCLILAAGYATRLYPLTENFPKPLLEVGGKSILDWLVDDIHGSGLVDGYAVISNHKFASHFEKWAKAKMVSSPGMNISVVDDGTSTNETRLGAVCDMKFAMDTLGIDDDILVIAGDNILDFSLQHFLNFAREKGTSCVMRYSEPDEAKLRKCGVMTVDSSDRILSMVEKPSEPQSHWVCPPFYYYTAADAARIGEAVCGGCGTDAPGSLVVWMASRVAVHAMPMPGRRFDVGNLESYSTIRDTYQGIL